MLIVNDPLGLSLIAGLAAKEIPFLLLMTLAALGALPVRRSVLLAETQGYGRVTAWIKAVFPRIYPQIRLPVYAVLAFSASVVDVALILGPTTPSALSVQVLARLNDPDVARIGRAWIRSGARERNDGVLRGASAGLPALPAAAVLFGLAGLAV